MADRAHIRFHDPDWIVVKKYNSEAGRVINEDGSRTSPVQIGYVSGNDRVVPIAVVTNDTSTGADILRTVDETVDGTAVTRTVTIRDLTVQEIADRGTNTANERFMGIGDDAVLDAMRDAMHRMNNRIRQLEKENQAIAALLVPALDLGTVIDNTWTKAEFNTWLKGLVQSSVDGGAR